MYVFLVAKFLIGCFNKMSQILQYYYKGKFDKGHVKRYGWDKKRLVFVAYPTGYGWGSKGSKIHKM